MSNAHLNPLKLLLLYGGRSGEHEISLISAASVLQNLDPARYQIIPVGMDKEGKFYLNDYSELLNAKTSLPVMGSNAKPLDSLFSKGQLAIDADVVFPMAHGPLYEDGCLQGVLKLANVAYVGCDVLSSAIAMDKDVTRRLAGVSGIKSARYRALSWYASAQELDTFCQETVADLGWPLFVKPCCLGSSVGIHKVSAMEELKRAIVDAKRYDETVLVEEYISGREIELAVLENKNPMLRPLVSIPGEIKVKHVDGFYSYTAKYLESNQTELFVPAVLEESLIQRLQQIAGDVFTQLKCKGMARVDFFVNEKTQEIYFNEVNTIPGFTPISMYPKLWAASGIAYPELLNQLISLAMRHHDCRQQLVTHYQ